jgi:CRISPR/Cas system-associated protein Cas5 (RAMP superfamily)
VSSTYSFLPVTSLIGLLYRHKNLSSGVDTSYDHKHGGRKIRQSFL